MKRILALAGLSVIVSHALARQTYPILLTSMQDELLSSNRQAGLLVTVTFAAYMVGVAVMTTISGRTEPRHTLTIGLGLSTLGFMVLVIANSFAVLGAGMSLAGLGSAFIWLSVPAIATGSVDAGRRGLVMGFLSSSIGVGVLLVGQAVRIVRQVADDESIWRPIWFGAALFTFAIMALVALFLRPAPTEPAETSLNLNVLRQVRGWVPLTLAYILFGFVVSSYGPFLGAKYEQDGFSRSHIATLYSLIGVAAVFGAVSLGRLSDRIGRKPVLAGAMAVLVCSSLLVLVGREPYATISVLLNGAASFAFPVLVTTQLRDHVSDRAFSNALGAITLIYGVSLVIGPLIGGSIGDSAAGFDLLYFLIAVVAAGSAVLILFIPGSGRPGRGLTRRQRWRVSAGS